MVGRPSILLPPQDQARTRTGKKITMSLANRAIGYDEVVARDLRFAMVEATVPRHWFNDEPWLTHFMNGILAAVPDGERWVMRSARRQMGKLTDPGIRRAASQFIRQEAIHAREHDVMNAIATRHGVPLDKVEATFKKLRLSLQDTLSDEMQSSLAAAFEHMTATIASILLDHPETFHATTPELRAMLYWHFVEETEHKSVSFDVFMDSSGGGIRAYFLRTGGMAMATILGVPLMLGNHAYLLYADKQLSNWRSAARTAGVLFVRPGILTGVLKAYLPYYLPTFHPWDDDNRPVIHAWKREFERTGDAINAFEALRTYIVARPNNTSPPTATAAATLGDHLRALFPSSASARHS